jgi:hypothetical protein
MLSACGGDDSKSDSAAEPSPAAQSEQPGADNSSETESQAGGAGGSGGASATDAQSTAGDKRKGKRRPAPPAEPDSGKSSKPAQKKPRTPSEHLTALSPAERRKLERDLYEQGKNVCYAQGPKEIAKSYKFPSTDPETVARLYARAYEQGIPELALPFQQGCLAGFKRYARNPS